jgi:hypothetical protein
MVNQSKPSYTYNAPYEESFRWGNHTLMRANLIKEILEAHDRGEFLEPVREGYALKVHKDFSKPGNVLATKHGILYVLHPHAAVRMTDDKSFKLEVVDYSSPDTAFLYSATFEKR